MPVQVKQKRYTMRHKKLPNVNKSYSALNLEEAALTALGEMGYELFEDDAEDVPFVIVPPEPPFNMKLAILQSVFKNKKPIMHSQNSCSTEICVKGTVGDSHLEPLSGEYMGKSR